MRYSKEIFKEFVKFMKISSTEDYWENLSYSEQKDYLDQHPASRKKITAPQNEYDEQAPEDEKERLRLRLENRKKNLDTKVSGPFNEIGPVERENINKIKDHILQKLKDDPKFNGISVSHDQTKDGPGIRVNFHHTNLDHELELESYLNNEHKFFIPRRNYQDLRGISWAKTPHPELIANDAVKHWNDRSSLNMGEIKKKKQIEDRRKDNDRKYGDNGIDQIHPQYQKNLEKMKDQLLNEIDQTGQFDGVSFDVQENKVYPSHSLVNVIGHKKNNMFQTNVGFYLGQVGSMTNDKVIIKDILNNMEKVKNNVHQNIGPRAPEPGRHWTGD